MFRRGIACSLSSPHEVRCPDPVIRDGGQFLAFDPSVSHRREEGSQGSNATAKDIAKPPTSMQGVPCPKTLT